MERVQKLADGKIGIRELSMVEIGSVTVMKRRRRIVGIVGVIEMDPEKERSTRAGLQPRKRAIDHDRSSPLYAIVTVFTRPAAVKIGIVSVESAIEPWDCRALWVEDLRSDDSGGVIPPLVKDVWKVRNVFRQGSTQIIQVIELGIGSRKDCGMGWSGEGDLGIGVSKNHALSRETVEIRRQAIT